MHRILRQENLIIDDKLEFAEFHNRRVVALTVTKISYKSKYQQSCVQKHLGIFTNKDDAITARANAEIQYFGEFRAIIPV